MDEWKGCSYTIRRGRDANTVNFVATDWRIFNLVAFRVLSYNRFCKVDERWWQVAILKLFMTLHNYTEVFYYKCNNFSPYRKLRTLYVLRVWTNKSRFIKTYFISFQISTRATTAVCFRNMFIYIAHLILSSSS